MSALSVIEENPAIAIGGVVVVLILLSLRGGSGNSGQMIAAQLKAQETASKTDVALATINADQAKNRTQVVGDVYKTKLVTSSQLAMTKDTNAAKVQLGMAGYEARLREVEAGERVATRAIVANQETAAQQINLQSSAIINASDLKRFEIQTNSANLPSILRSRETVAGITSQQMQAIAALQTEASRTSASAQARSSDSGSFLNTLGTIASFFF